MTLTAGRLCCFLLVVAFAFVLFVSCFLLPVLQVSWDFIIPPRV